MSEFSDFQAEILPPWVGDAIDSRLNDHDFEDIEGRLTISNSMVASSPDLFGWALDAELGRLRTTMLAEYWKQRQRP